MNTSKEKIIAPRFENITPATELGSDDETIGNINDLSLPSITNDVDSVDHEDADKAIDKKAVISKLEELSPSSINTSPSDYLRKDQILLSASTARLSKSIEVSPRDALMRIIQQATYELASIDAAAGIFIDTRPAQDRILENTIINAAVVKLMSLKGSIEYQTARGRAALNVMEWLKKNIIDAGHLTAAELRLVPLATYRDFDPRLYQAIMNSDRAQPR